MLSLLFACCCFLHYWGVVILTAVQTTTVVYFLCCVCSSEGTDWFQWLFLVGRGTGRNEHGVIVEWISACLWCLVSACSSSVYVLYLFGRFSFGRLSTCVNSARSWRWAKWERKNPQKCACSRFFWLPAIRHYIYYYVMGNHSRWITSSICTKYVVYWQVQTICAHSQKNVHWQVQILSLLSN